MQKIIFGSTLILSGVIGFTGWCIAGTQIVQPGARSSVLGCLRGVDWVIALLFMALFIVGLNITVNELKKK